MSHVNNEGTIDYPEKERAWISDSLDRVEMLYFGFLPDGDNQQRIFDQCDAEMTDLEAYTELVTRLNNALLPLV